MTDSGRNPYEGPFGPLTDEELDQLERELKRGLVFGAGPVNTRRMVMEIRASRRALTREPAPAGQHPKCTAHQVGCGPECVPICEHLKPAPAPCGCRELLRQALEQLDAMDCTGIEKPHCVVPLRVDIRAALAAPQCEAAGEWEVEAGWEMAHHAIGGHGVGVMFAGAPCRIEKGDHVMVLRRSVQQQTTNEQSKAEQVAQAIAAIHGLDVPPCECGHGEPDHYRDKARACCRRESCGCTGYRRAGQGGAK